MTTRLNWREALVRYTASVLDEIGLKTEAALMRSWEVPILDGSGVIPVFAARIPSTRWQYVMDGRSFGSVPDGDALAREYEDEMPKFAGYAFMVPASAYGKQEERPVWEIDAGSAFDDQAVLEHCRAMRAVLREITPAGR